MQLYLYQEDRPRQLRPRLSDPHSSDLAWSLLEGHVQKDEVEVVVSILAHFPSSLGPKTALNANHYQVIVGSEEAISRKKLILTHVPGSNPAVMRRHVAVYLGR
jgi:hypothetical protein